MYNMICVESERTANKVHTDMEMTLRAINSLITSTPVVFVGILVPPNYGIKP